MKEMKSFINSSKNECVNLESNLSQLANLIRKLKLINQRQFELSQDNLNRSNENKITDTKIFLKNNTNEQINKTNVNDSKENGSFHKIHNLVSKIKNNTPILLSSLKENI